MIPRYEESDGEMRVLSRDGVVVASAEVISLDDVRIRLVYGSLSPMETVALADGLLAMLGEGVL